MQTRELPAGAGREAACLCLEGVSKRFDATPVVDAVSLTIRHQEIFALLGSSGCGKTTLLRMIAGLETPSAGRILLDGEDLAEVPAFRRPTNMMFQSYALFPHLTVAGNVAFGLQQQRPRPGRAQIAARVAEMLELVQMSAYAGRKPHELSGGQQQRVALARSLAREPRLLLLDEPLAALDKKIRQHTQLELVGLIRRVGVTCILVTHDQEEAMTMADRIGIMSEGRLLQVGTPDEIYLHPNCRFSAEFIGETNLFCGRVDNGWLLGSDFPAALAVASPRARIEPAWVSVRPERIRLLPHPDAAGAGSGLGNRATGEVCDIAYLGSHSICHVRLDGGRRLIVSIPDGHFAVLPVRGERVCIGWQADDGVVLDT